MRPWENTRAHARKSQSLGEAHSEKVFEEALRLMNEAVAAGDILDYAIAGSYGVLYYTEPFYTHDLDFMVLFRGGPKDLVPLTFFQRFLAAGFRWSGLGVKKHGLLVEAIPTNGDLDEEAVDRAAPIKVGGTPTKVLRIEHLIAIKLRTGRGKDFAHIQTALDQASIDEEALYRILRQHRLLGKFKEHFGGFDEH